jgi:hypothetical protein
VLPLGKYGLDGEKAAGELLNFSDSSGSPQVRASCYGAQFEILLI